MKKSIACAAILAAGICNANAQSSVTLYGRVASGLDMVSNVAMPNGQTTTNFRFGSNQYGPSWWGVIGKEDLGDGLHAVFNLESQFTAGTGQTIGQSTFNRYAYAGLEKDGWGALWAGQVMSLTDETGYYLDPFVEQITGIGNFARGRAWGSRSNTVTYNSPKWSGFSFRLQNGFGNVAGDFRASRQFSANATYATGNLKAYAVYEEIRDPNGRFSDPYESSREYMAGGTYQIGPVRLYAGYQALVSSGQDTVASADNPYGATRNQQEWLGAVYRVTPAWAIQAGWFHGSANNGAGTGNLGVLGTTYDLSKRTFLYATVAGMFNGRNADFPVETGDSPPLPGHNQAGGYLGVMHYF